MTMTRLFSTGVLLSLAGACATGSTLGSGVGDRILEHPPFYAGATMTTGGGSISHLPVGYQRGAMQDAMFEPASGSGTPTAALVQDLTAYLDSLGVTTRLAGSVSRGTAPDVQFSCETDPADTGEECLTGPGALGRGDIRMRLAVARPSAEWVSWAGAAMDAAGVTSVLVLTLEVGQYRIAQRGLRGDKVVELGTGHTVSLPWLTSLETPVQVLQLTGALIGRDGKAVRIGAEGLLARRTGLPASAVGLERLLTDAEVAELRAARRDDLPGRPLVWQHALRTLVGELTGRQAP